jgi:hypothetical protein
MDWLLMLFDFDLCEDLESFCSVAAPTSAASSRNKPENDASWPESKTANALTFRPMGEVFSPATQKTVAAGCDLREKNLPLTGICNSAFNLAKAWDLLIDFSCERRNVSRNGHCRAIAVTIKGN